jgi:hypothetical protein
MAISQDERNRRAALVANECDGIEPQYIAFYAQAILYASERAAASFSRFESGLQEVRYASEIVGFVHEALGHTAALSRFFFVGRKASELAQARARQLRREFKVEQASLLLNRDLRNALEHFDERLDHFLLEDIFGYVFPGAILGDADMADDEAGHIFRMVDPKRQIFVLFGEKYQFGAVRTEVIRIAKLAKTRT